MDLPGEDGTVEGEWDLRGKEAIYLGGVPLSGKRVLEAGTASGQLCFYMEEMGAEVVGYDLSEAQEWDLVPYAGYDYALYVSERKKHMNRINRGYWFAHQAKQSRAKVVYGTVYEPPAAMGSFDIVTFGSILLHLRDPFLALQRMCAHAKETVIVTDMLPASSAMSGADKRLIRFLPDADTNEPHETWWHLSPELVEEFLHILGFPHTQISYHEQLCLGRPMPLYTVVGHRKPQASAVAAPKGEALKPQPHPQQSQNQVSAAADPGTIRFSVLARHLLMRALRAVPKRLFGRKNK
ncbi:MAG: methyltransferase domain-containing protein [Balneolales bacterium]|nr:methyltransferase domain-containing protein [Balneolales bacterium]